MRDLVSHSYYEVGNINVRLYKTFTADFNLKPILNKISINYAI